MAGPPPATVDRWEGRLPRRDADEQLAAAILIHSTAPWPRERTLIGISPYRERFKNGATIYPRRFFIVEPEPSSRLGIRRDAPRVRGRAGALDNAPWTTVDPPSGPIEAQFLRQVILGETIAPYRLLQPVMGVIPMVDATVLNSTSATASGFRHLAAWLRDAESKWNKLSNKKSDGSPRMTLLSQLDHMRKLSTQAGTPSIRVLYTKSGTRLSAAILIAEDALIDHKAYWSRAHSIREARYLIAIINSTAVLSKVVDLQPHGQRDKRDFDNLVWTLPIPEYDEADQVHRDLADLAERAEQIAATLNFDMVNHFTTKRRVIREALVDDGVAAEIELLVDAILPP